MTVIYRGGRLFCMKYTIGSFNMHNLGKNAQKNGRNLQKIANIIKDEKFDIIALQEISTGEAFTQNDGILEKLGNDYDFRRGNAHGDGLGFLWKKNRLKLLEEPQILIPEKEGHKISKGGYYGRFTPYGLSEEEIFEFRLISIHIIFGNNSDTRRKELDFWLKDIFPRYSIDKNNKLIQNCAIVCGDYNLELFEPGRNKDNCIYTDSEGIITSEKYDNMKIKTIQDQPTTISNSKDDYACNYDHFSFNYDRFQKLSYKLMDCGCNYEDLQKFKREVSDHIPIKMEIEI